MGLRSSSLPNWTFATLTCPSLSGYISTIRPRVQCPCGFFGDMTSTTSSTWMSRSTVNHFLLMLRTGNHSRIFSFFSLGWMWSHLLILVQIVLQPAQRGNGWTSVVCHLWDQLIDNSVVWSSGERMFCESNESMSYESSVNESTGRIRGVFHIT